MGKTVSYKRTSGAGASEGQAYLAEPTGDGKVGAVVLFHEWWGLNAHCKDLSDRLAKEGFLVVALDMYDGKVTADPAEATKLMNDLDTLDVMARTRDVVAFVKAQSRSNGKVGVTGFCLGGAMSFGAACHVPGLSAVVPFYGIPAPQKVDYAKVTAPIQAHFAKNDEWATVAKADAIVKGLVARGAEAELHVYDAGHAFMNDTRADAYHAESAALAWSRMVGFLAKHVG